MIPFDPYRQTGPTVAAYHWSAVPLPGSSPLTEPLTPVDLTAIARVLPSDSEPDLMTAYITAARAHVERDIGWAIPTQQIQVTFDALPSNGFVVLPWPPLQTVDAFVSIDDTDTPTPVDPASYLVDALSRPARLWLRSGVTPVVREFAGWQLTLTVGFPDGQVPPSLVHAIGLLATHYLQTGRDPTIVGTIVEKTPFGYDDDVAPFRLVTLV